MGVRNSDPEAMHRARELRKHMSLPEKMLWSRIRAGRLGFVVRRQYPIGPYVADFYVCELQICIEIDRAGHELSEERDMHRDGYFAGRGITVIRIAAKAVLADIDGIAEGLYHSLCERSGRDPLHLRS